MRAQKEFGNFGEQRAAEWLQKKGFTILQKNYTTRLGEVDIIALQDEFLLFVEVKTRKTAYFHASLVITKTKQQRIIKAAKLFMQKYSVVDKVCRFDVILVTKMNDDFEIEHLENAFQGR